MSQVHKETLTAVDNALPNRVGLDIEIFGMEGIPDEIAQQHQQRVLTNYHQDQANRQNANANGKDNAAKKPKLESSMSLKERLAAHKAAKLAAAEGDGTSSGGGTPQPTSQGQTPGAGNFVRTISIIQNDRILQYSQAASPSYNQYPQPYAAPPTNGSYNSAPSYPPQQSGPGYPGAPSYGQPPQSQPSFGQPPVSYPQNQPYAQPPQPAFQQPPPSYPPQPAFSPPPFQNQPPYPGQYPPNGAGHYGGQPGVPVRFGSGSPFQQPNHAQTSPAPSGFPQPVRTGSVSLPNAPGLPQRPAFGPPSVSGIQFQQMHHGQFPTPQNHHLQPQYHKHDAVPAPGVQPQTTAQAPPVNGVAEPPNAASIDDLISSASRQADAEANASHSHPSPAAKPDTSVEQAPTVTKKEAAEESKDAKKEGKEKAKPTRLVYSDNETSPEEKMAMLPRYAFSKPVAT